MQFIKRLLIVALLSAPAFAQNPAPLPEIHSIVPAVGPSFGGTVVTISGANLSLPPNAACLLPCPTRVAFGRAAAQLLDESNERLVVKTPPHTAGSVDVTVITGDGRITTARDAFVYTEEEESGYERVLLPIYLESDAPGSNGSMWKTQLFLRNNGTNGVTLAPWVCPLGALCPPVVPLTRTLQPGETLIALPRVVQTNPGRLLYLSREGADFVSADLRLYETSRSDTDAGVEIPIIREKDVRSAPAHLHNIPLNARFRVMLRIYELQLDAADYIVRVYPEAAGIANGPALTQFVLHIDAPETGTFRMHPGYAEYGGPFTSITTTEPVRIDVQPVQPGSRYWAFVSITNNDTQRVTLVTPQ